MFDNPQSLELSVVKEIKCNSSMQTHNSIMSQLVSLVTKKQKKTNDAGDNFFNSRESENERETKV